MVTAIIIGGGQIDEVGLLKMIHDESDACIIAADKGIEFCVQHNVVPDYAVGDFDSASAISQTALNRWGIPVKRLNPIKDDTDSESALNLAFEESFGRGEIYIFGGTGTRIDHILGNISILGQGIERGQRVFLQDANNRICVIDKPMVLEKEKAFGQYISIFPYTTSVKGLTLKGFKYPLEDFELTGYTSLGVSNEIIEDTAEIHFTEGVLIVVQSKD